MRLNYCVQKALMFLDERSQICVNYYLSICFLEEAENMVLRSKCLLPGFLLCHIPTLVSFWGWEVKPVNCMYMFWANEPCISSNSF